MQHIPSLLDEVRQALDGAGNEKSVAQRTWAHTRAQLALTRLRDRLSTVCPQAAALLGDLTIIDDPIHRQRVRTALANVQACLHKTTHTT